MDKIIQVASAIVIYNKSHQKVLTVHRPKNASAMPDEWGFPATVRENKKRRSYLNGNIYRFNTNKYGCIKINKSKDKKSIQSRFIES